MYLFSAISLETAHYFPFSIELPSEALEQNKEKTFGILEVYEWRHMGAEYEAEKSIEYNKSNINISKENCLQKKKHRIFYKVVEMTNTLTTRHF